MVSFDFDPRYYPSFLVDGGCVPDRQRLLTSVKDRLKVKTPQGVFSQLSNSRSRTQTGSHTTMFSSDLNPFSSVVESVKTLENGSTTGKYIKSGSDLIGPYSANSRESTASM